MERVGAPSAQTLMPAVPPIGDPGRESLCVKTKSVEPLPSVAARYGSGPETWVTLWTEDIGYSALRFGRSESENGTLRSDAVEGEQNHGPACPVDSRLPAGRIDRGAGGDV